MDSDEFYNSDHELDDDQHAKLVANVLNLSNKQNLKKPSRTEPTIKVSEFDLVKSVTGNKGSVHLSDLTQSLKQRVHHVEIGKKVRSIEKKVKTLQKPLEKPQAERIRRTVAYENTKHQLDRWDAVVTSNRAAAHLTFPLNQNYNLEKKETMGNFRLKSDLEKEIEQFKPEIEVFNIESEEKFPLTMEEIMEKRKENAKLRAHQGYKEAKARRQNKIKSKKYHRIQKRERVKQQLKDFELLQKTNPEAALLKLDEIEKARAEERVSLRHKSTGQWAKNKLIRAKYDKDTRQVLAQQLAISRDLTQKIKTNEETDSENEDAQTNEPILRTNNSYNPWLNNAKVKPNEEVQHFVSGYRQYWDDKNKGLEALQSKKVEEMKMDEVENIDENTDTRINHMNGIDANKSLEINEEKFNNLKKKKGTKTESIKKSPKQKKKQKVNTNNITRQLNDSAQSTSSWDVTIINEDMVSDEEDELVENKEPINSEESDSDVSTKEDLTIENEFYKLNSKMKNKVKEKYEKLTNHIELEEDNMPRNGYSSKKRTNFEALRLPMELKKAIIDEELLENHHTTDIDEDSNMDKAGLNKLKLILDANVNTAKPTTNIDPNKFMNIKTTQLNTGIPDLLSMDDNEENSSQRDVISEAFENDDILEEFTKEKQDDVEGDKPKNIDLNLPGWGAWGGKNLKVSTRKRKRFILKLPAKMPRRDDNKGNLIINEKCNENARPHLVSELPFPFTTVKDFEASIRAPIGSTFIPETAFRKLTRPALTTKLGAVIDPMDEDILLKKNKKK